MQARPAPLPALQTINAGLVAALVAAGAYAWAAAASRALGADAAILIKALIVAPLVEEFAFRGFVQARLRALPGLGDRPWVVIFVTAIAFGVVHLVSASPLHAALVTLPAVAFGWVFERTRSIALCVVLHSAANAIWIGFWSF